jgi:hypothetical protein
MFVICLLVMVFVFEKVGPCLRVGMEGGRELSVRSAAIKGQVQE